MNSKTTWKINNIIHVIGAICAAIGFTNNMPGLMAVGLYWLTLNLLD